MKSLMHRVGEGLANLLGIIAIVVGCAFQLAIGLGLAWLGLSVVLWLLATVFGIGWIE